MAVADLHEIQEPNTERSKREQPKVTLPLLADELIPPTSVASGPRTLNSGTHGRATAPSLVSSSARRASPRAQSHHRAESSGSGSSSSRSSSCSCSSSRTSWSGSTGNRKRRPATASPQASSSSFDSVGARASSCSSNEGKDPFSSLWQTGGGVKRSFADIKLRRPALKRQRVAGILSIPVPPSRVPMQQAASSSTEDTSQDPKKDSARLGEITDRRPIGRKLIVLRSTPQRDIPGRASFHKSPPRKSNQSRIAVDRRAPQAQSSSRKTSTRGLQLQGGIRLHALTGEWEAFNRHKAHKGKPFARWTLLEDGTAIDETGQRPADAQLQECVLCNGAVEVKRTDGWCINMQKSSLAHLIWEMDGWTVEWVRVEAAQGPQPRSAVVQDGIVSITFRMGSLGMRYDKSDGTVQEVFDGQAKAAGVKAGWRMLKFDGSPWSKDLFRSRLDRTTYEVTFSAKHSKKKPSAPLVFSPRLSKPGPKASGKRRTTYSVPKMLQTKPPGSERFPKINWAESMIDVLAEELQETLQGQGLGQRAALLGTDCSGAEAPIFALKEITRVLALQLGVTLEIDHRFACDVDFAPRNFIRKNCKPRALFADLLARNQIGHCLLEERPRMVPGNLDIYIAGFPCKDFSLLNKNRPGMEGPNAKVFYGVVDYIKQYQPRTFILENVQGLMMSHKGCAAPIAFVLETLRSIPGYQVHYWKVDTRNFHLPQHRVRVYIVGVHIKKARLRRPLQDWDELLEALQSPAKYAAHAYMLQESEPEVRKVRKELGRKHFRFRSRTWRVVSAHAQGLNRHVHGFRWVSKHVRLRRKYGLGDDQPLTQHGTGWTSLLSTRMRDVLEITAKKLECAIGSPAVESMYLAEISRGAAYTSTMDACTPCVTPTCLTWVFCRWRWLIGLEKLALQGFPVDDLNLEGFKESEIQSLAGNAMSVPVVGALLLLVLALVEFPESSN